MIELLAPAGDEKSFYTAINAGANAVYLGLKEFSARRNAENFTADNISSIDISLPQISRAFVGQFSTHLPHKIHFSLLIECFLFKEWTPLGQEASQALHPIHLFG